MSPSDILREIEKGIDAAIEKAASDLI